MAARVKPPTPAQEAQAMLDTMTAVLELFPGAVVSGSLAYGETAVRCAGHVVGQTGRIDCGNVVDPKRGSMCEDPRGCRKEGRVTGYGL